MSRNFSIPFTSRDAELPTTDYARHTETPGNNRPGLAFSNSSPDESAMFPFMMPTEFTGTGTLKADIVYAANTTTAADGVRWDVFTEPITPDAGTLESVNSDAFDGTVDRVTGNFSTTAWSLHKVTVTLTPGTAFAASDKGRLKLERNTAHADDDLVVDGILLDVVLYEEA